MAEVRVIDDLSLCDALLDEDSAAASRRPCTSKRSLPNRGDFFAAPSGGREKAADGGARYKLLSQKSAGNLLAGAGGSGREEQSEPLLTHPRPPKSPRDQSRRPRSSSRPPHFHPDRRPPTAASAAAAFQPAPVRRADSGAQPPGSLSASSLTGGAHRFQARHQHTGSSSSHHSVGQSADERPPVGTGIANPIDVQQHFPPAASPASLAMVVRNADGTVDVERGRQHGFYSTSTPPELVGQPKFRAHRGRNRFFCCGRLMMSRSNGAFFITLTLIFSTMICFFVFDAAYVAEHISLALPICASLLFIAVLANLFKTSFTDPGILPRAGNKEVLEHERLYRIETGNPQATNPRSKSVPVLQQCVVVKYCYTCRLFRPPRLVPLLHCPWVGNCVGQRNYRHFYFFILLLTILDLFVGGCAVAHLAMLSVSQKTFVNAIQLSPGSLFVSIMCFLSVWSVLGLSGFHTYLLASNQTTNEEVKDTFADMWPSYCGSLYSKGNFFTNCMGTLCAPEIPSMLDRRGRIAPDRVVTVQPEAIQRARKSGIAFALDPTAAAPNGQWTTPDGERREDAGGLVENRSATMSSSSSIHSYSSSCSVQRVADDPPQRLDSESDEEDDETERTEANRPPAADRRADAPAEAPAKAETNPRLHANRHQDSVLTIHSGVVHQPDVRQADEAEAKTLEIKVVGNGTAAASDGKIQSEKI
ncbi:Palmitoyltransferase [Aphelenchoides fujianensis]|nr:Palmitoyltransferase [Aphelenchoides fujianensis]